MTAAVVFTCGPVVIWSFCMIMRTNLNAASKANKKQKIVRKIMYAN